VRDRDWKQAEREELERHSAEFYARGGKKQIIPPGFSGETFSFNNQKKERQDHSRRAAKKRWER